MRYESLYDRYYGIDPYNPGNALKQHGIMGQKWGIWNEETRARYLGSNRKKEIGGLFKLKFGYSDSGKKSGRDLSSLSEKEKKEIDKKYFKKKTSSYKYRPLKEDGTYGDFIEKKYDTYDINGKKLVDDLDPEFFTKIDAEKNVYNAYEKNHLTEKKMVQVLDNYWYGHDFSLNMFPVYMTEAEFKKEMKDYWAKDATDSQIKLIYDYMVAKTDYADKVEKICDEASNKLGISDDMQWRASSALYSAFVNNEKSSKEIIRDVRNFSHSDISNNSYYAVDQYNPGHTLKQHGIIGQKWGIWNEETRARYLGGGSKSKWFSKITDRFTNKPKEDPHLKRTHLSKELAEISDAELNAAIKRMQLEQTYLDMLKKYPTASDRGQKFANQFSDELFKNLSTGLGGAIGKRVSKAVDDWINADSKNEEQLKKEKEEKEKKAKREKLRKEAEKLGDEKIKKDNSHETIVNAWIDNRMKE